MQVPFLVLVVLTIALNVQLYRFVHLYRRVTGDTSESFFDHTRTRWFRLLTRHYELSELRREQAISVALLLIWLIAAAVVITSPL